MTIRPFLHLPPPAPFSNLADLTAYLRRMYESLTNTRRGKLECVTELTLTENAATTVLNYKGLSPQSVVIFDPKTANAAAELAAGTMYVLTADRGNDEWTVTHNNSAQTDRTFQIACIG
jgi:hypothetical protein